LATLVAKALTSTDGDDSIIGTNADETLSGGLGNDNISGVGGNDILNGVNSNNINPGIGERDNLSGGSGSDRFILGDNANIYYDDRNITTNGSNDYATITDFNPSEDKVKLQGIATNYRLETSGSNTNLYIDKAGSEPDELIAVFQNVTGLNLTSGAFEYITPVNAFAFSSAIYSVNETGTAQVTVIRTGSLVGQVSVTLISTNGTAQAPSDYNQIPISVIFNDGENSKTVTIPIVDDTTFELNETINLALSNPSNGFNLGGQNTATLTIIDNDTPVPGILAFSSATYSINEDGTPVVAVTLTRTGGSDLEVSATIVLSNGTASAGEDYNNQDIVVTFADKQTSKTVTIPIINDTVYEPTETVNLTLSNPTGGATLGTQKTATLNIVDNDAIPGTIQFSNTAYSVNENGTPVTAVTLTRTGGSDGAVSATINLTNGTATAGSDYNNTPITVKFANGETSKIVGLIKSGKIIVANDEWTLSDSGFSNAPDDSQLFAQNIANYFTDGKKGSFLAYSNNFGFTGTQLSKALTDAGHQWKVAHNLPFTLETLRQYNGVFLGGLSVDNQVLIDYVNSGGNVYLMAGTGSFGSSTGEANAWKDFLNNFGLSFANQWNSISGSIPINSLSHPIFANIDRLYQNNGNTIIDLNSNDNQGVLIAKSNDGQGLYAIYESHFQANTIPIVNDSQFEADETVNLTLSNPQGGATLGTQTTAVLTIINDDLPQRGIISLNSSTYTVNENGTTASINLTRTGGSDGEVTVILTPSDNTATAGSDYNNSPITVTFTNGETSKNVTIPIIDNNVYEPTETVNLTLSNPTGGATLGTQKTATLNIVDNDAVSGTIQFSNTAYSVNENGTAISAVTLTRTGGSDGAVSATINLTNGTATAGSDYNNTPITVNFADAEISKTVNIPIIDDSILESNETINLSLSNPTNGVSIGAQNSAVVNIIDNDFKPTLTVNITAEQINEGNTIQGTITRNTATTEPLTVTLVNSDNAQLTVPATVTIPAGANSATFNITAVNDTLIELPKNYTIIASAAGFISGSDTLAIIDNDAVTLSLSFNTNNINENGGKAIATVTRNVVTDTPLLVQLYSSDTTEATVPATVIIAANQASATFEIQGIDDVILDGTQAVVITAKPT
ncbi:Calx-beta domain-containing protein, partial [Dolichospermum lemmermannii CS-548]|uniref:Calx-beta domain-containing protein n=1 Tax=Dolichospermum lemmermannii TaxID=54295 RepID=UPI00232C666B